MVNNHWLVAWNIWIIISIQLGMSSTDELIFFRGVGQTTNQYLLNHSVLLLMFTFVYVYLVLISCYDCYLVFFISYSYFRLLCVSTLIPERYFVIAIQPYIVPMVSAGHGFHPDKL